MKSLIYIFIFLSFLGKGFAQPDRIWATYLGSAPNGSNGSMAENIVFAEDGFLYVSGMAWAGTTNISTPGSFQQSQPGALFSAFIAKFDTSGNRIWSTFIGNEMYSLPPKIKVDISGNIVATGLSRGVQNNISSPGSYRPNIPFQNGEYSYLIKFNSQGQRLWGTYMESGTVGNRSQYDPQDISTDQNGNIFICGRVSGFLEEVFNGTYMTTGVNNTENSFLLKYSPDGNFVWGTYYATSTEFTHLAVNNSGQIYVTGTAKVPGIASPGAFYPNYSGNTVHESFIAKFSASGQRLWATYTNGMERISGIIARPLGGFYLCAATQRDTGIATHNTHQQQFYGNTHDFCLSSWDDDGRKIWGTYYGGNGNEFHGTQVTQNFVLGQLFTHKGISLDPLGNVLIVGGTESNNRIKFGCTYAGDENSPAPMKGFMAKFDSLGTILWGSYYDVPIKSVSCGDGESFYIATETVWDGIATSGAFQPTKTTGVNSGYLGKLHGDFKCPEIAEQISYTNNQLSIGIGYDSYQWFYNGAPIAGANSSQCTATDSGIYYVVFTNECDCSYVSDTLLFPPLPISINRINTDLQVDLFPNPADTEVFVQGRIGFGQRIIIATIIDLKGQRVATSKAKVLGGNFSFDLDIKSLDSGLYFVLLKTEDGNTALSRKLLKLK